MYACTTVVYKLTETCMSLVSVGVAQVGVVTVKFIPLLSCQLPDS